MPTPTPLSICTSSLTRLLKEERSYHAELAMQQKNLERLQTTAAAEAEGAAEENREFVLRQERKALEETKAVFPRLRERIQGAVGQLEGLLASMGEGDGDDAEVARAREAIEEARQEVF